MLVRDPLYKPKNFKNVKFARGITYGIKVFQITKADRMKNRFFLLLTRSFQKIGAMMMSDRTQGEFPISLDLRVES